MEKKIKCSGCRVKRPAAALRSCFSCDDRARTADCATNAKNANRTCQVIGNAKWATEATRLTQAIHSASFASIVLALMMRGAFAQNTCDTAASAKPFCAALGDTFVAGALMMRKAAKHSSAKSVVTFRAPRKACLFAPNTSRKCASVTWMKSSLKCRRNWCNCF